MPGKMDIPEYLDQHGVQRAVVMTTNRAANVSRMMNNEKNGQTSDTGNLMEAFAEMQQTMVQGQLDHADVIRVSKLAPGRFVAFFWFNAAVASHEYDENFERGLSTSLA